MSKLPPLRLAYIDPMPVPGPQPSALQILQQVDAFAAVGVALDLVTPQPDGRRVEDFLGRPFAAGLRVHHQREWRRQWFFPFSSSRPFMYQVLRWLKRHPVDALYVRNLKLADWLLQQRPDLPLIFETHELFAQSYREAGGNKPVDPAKLQALESRERRVYRQARGLVAITQALADDIAAAYGPVAPTLVAPDGVDLTMALADSPANSPTDSPATPNNALPVLLYLGSLHPWKGVELLVRAMRDVTSAVLHIAGGNPQRIGELQALAGQLGVAERVVLLGPVPPTERFKLIAGVDICLLPLTLSSIGSRYTSPLKLFEYMAMGKAIVASDLPALREVLRDGDNALLTAPEDPPAIAAAINRLLADPALCQRLGQQAASESLRYDWPSRARAISGWAGQHLLPPAGQPGETS